MLTLLEVGEISSSSIVYDFSYLLARQQGPINTGCTMEMTEEIIFLFTNKYLRHWHILQEINMNVKHKLTTYF